MSGNTVLVTGGSTGIGCSFAKNFCGRAIRSSSPAGHGSELLFWEPFNQVFTYHMERFMALEGR